MKGQKQVYVLVTCSRNWSHYLHVYGERRQISEVEYYTTRNIRQ